MAFGDKTPYKIIGHVLAAYQLHYTQSEVLKIDLDCKAPLALQNYISFSLKNTAYKASEAAVCENLIYPVLREAWSLYTDELMLWSHQSIMYDKILRGTPDYIFTKKSPLGKPVFESPYVAVVEAKLDDFVGGWAQCALEMYTMQKINAQDEKPIFGIVSNGETWQFASLHGNEFKEHIRSYSIFDLDILHSCLIYILEQCK